MNIVVYTFAKMSSTEGYKALFKGSVVLATLFLVSTMQVTNVALPLEKSAHELWHKVEVQTGKVVESIDKLECNIEQKSTYSDCKMAKYQKDLSGSSLDALLEFQSLVQWVACFLFAASAFGFFANPYMHPSQNASSIPSGTGDDVESTSSNTDGTSTTNVGS
ncbi:hypothetical protein M2H10_21020 [Vibrio vulnificus]|uniref:Uncharacterized protein n=2 Tax=Vibrio harveyi TaxID=669 RepID=A0A8B3DB78_VIBHA|nr:hypothetical protein [Vibrio vulnificus]RIW01200.1 hypothetical protein DS957_026495 [Vibrio harveyi]